VDHGRPARPHHSIERRPDAAVAPLRRAGGGFKRNKLDRITLSNHLRVSDKDHAGNNVPGGPIPLSKGVALFEIPAITALQNAGSYADNTIFSSVEWDMPTHEHFNIGIVSGAAGSDAAVKS
jgi:hypothetical protein